MNSRDDTIIALWSRNKNLHAVAEAASVEPLTAYRVLREYGVIEEIAGWEDGIVPPRKGGRKVKVAGDKFERRVMRDLYDRGVGYVLKSHMSRGAQDLIAFRPHCVPCFIQCKVDGYITPAERAALLELAHKSGGKALLARPDENEVAYLEVVAGEQQPRKPYFP